MSAYAEIFSSSWAFLVVLLFFGGSIFVHEFGHFIAAKWRGLKVLRFSMGFGPKLISWRGKDGCKYMISLLPLGGYVALPQLADMGSLEGAEDEDLKNAAKLAPITTLDKIIVSAAGAVFNIIFAVVLAAAVYFIGLPQSAFNESNVVGYVSENLTDIDGKKLPSPAKAAGLQIGDKILEIDLKPVKKFSDVIEFIALGAGRDKNGNALANIKIERNAKIIDLEANPVLLRTNPSTSDAIRVLGISAAHTMKVGSLMENSPAQKSGLKVGDEILGIDNQKLYSNQQLADYLEKIGDDKFADLKILRNSKELSLKIKPEKVLLSKPLCEVSIGDGGELKLFNSNSSDAKSECVKVFSQKVENPYFEKVATGDILYAADGKKISNITQLNALINHIAGKAKIKLSFMSSSMQMNEIYLPLKSASKILPAKERVMLGYSLSLEKSVKHPSIAEQFKDAIDRTWGALASLVNPKSDVGISSLAGPVDIGRVIYQLSLQDISLVISFAVLLNINLAFLNLLPIPVLDGGHILFALISKISGKKIPPTFMAATQGIFSVLFISLMVYVVYIGFMRWSGDAKMESADNIYSEYYIKNIKFKNHE